MADKKNFRFSINIPTTLCGYQILTKQQITVLQQKIGIVFHDSKFLEWAFVHRSYLNEKKMIHQEHNERLEFLGDAVLEFIVTDRLFRSFPDKSEGILTSYRIALVNGSRLSNIADVFGLYEFIAMSKGQKNDNERTNRCILANTLLTINT